MKKTIAERKLLFSSKGSDIRKEFVIRIDAPYIVDQNMVEFSVGDGLVGCHVEAESLPEGYHHEVYGLDEVQALNIATNVEPFLKRLSSKYDLYWSSGEPYFDEEEKEDG